MGSCIAPFLAAVNSDIGTASQDSGIITHLYITPQFFFLCIILFELGVTHNDITELFSFIGKKIRILPGRTCTYKNLGDFKLDISAKLYGSLSLIFLFCKRGMAIVLAAGGYLKIEEVNT